LLVQHGHHVRIVVNERDERSGRAGCPHEVWQDAVHSPGVTAGDALINAFDPWDELPQMAGERRKALGLTQAQVARYVQAIGGHIQISAVFGDDHYILRGTVTEAA
jgi:hypothetical protein